MELTSPVFRPGESIPQKYTCDGENISPPLAWSGMPGNTQSLSLILEDPDAPRGTFTHWIFYNLAPDRTQLPEGFLSEGKQGKNDFGKTGYGGPCPPPGTTHRYIFRLYALDQAINLNPGASRQQFQNAIQGHVLTQAELAGRYARR